jgi:hypothetical protein
MMLIMQPVNVSRKAAGRLTLVIGQEVLGLPKLEKRAGAGVQEIPLQG